MYETSAAWTVTGTDGTIVQFNNGGHLCLDEVTGFDSPNVRPNIEDLPETDGAVAGDYFFGSRPITLSGLIDAPDAATRNLLVSTMQRCFRALRSDLNLTSQPQGMPLLQVNGRLENFRVTGGFKKRFQIGLVCPDPRIYSAVQATRTTTASPSTVGAPFPWRFPIHFGGGSGGTANLTASNAGNIATPPVIKVTGPITEPQIKNSTTGKSVYLDGVTLAASEYVTVDVGARTVVRSDGANLYSKVRFPDSTWWLLEPGANVIQLWAASSSAGVQLDVSWWDAWC